jgi:hypothetical protein
MIVHVVNVVGHDGKILVQREFNSHIERQTYADLLVEILSYLEDKKVKRVEKELIKENKALKNVLSSAREIEDKFVVTEMVFEKV